MIQLVCEGTGSIPTPVQWVKDLVLLQLWCRSQLQLRINSWPENFQMPLGWPKQKTEKPTKPLLVPAADAYCLLEVYWALCREPARFHLSGDLGRSLRPGRSEKPPLPQQALAYPQQVGEAPGGPFIRMLGGRGDSLSLKRRLHRVGDVGGSPSGLAPSTPAPLGRRPDRAMG